MKFLRKILLPTLLLVALSCSPNKSKSEKSKEENSANKIKTTDVIPSISKLVMAPPPPQIGGDKIISFSVTDQIPLKDVLIELGRVAQIDVDLDSSISGGIVLNAKNRPLKEVIDRIASLGKLTYSYKNGVLYFEKDTPYYKNYFVDFLSGSKLWSDVESNISAILSDGNQNSANGGRGATQNIDPNNQAAPVNDSSNNISRQNSNKSAGIISVYATKSQHNKVEKYLEDVYRSSSAQVLIEAKVIEVTLSKEFDTGINWNWVNDGKSAKNAGTFGSSSGSVASFSATVPKVKLLGLGGDLSANIQLLEQFGKTRSVSSPRISALNNQKALLDFSQKYVYFTVSATAAQSVSSTISSANVINSTVTATKNEVDLGTKLEITPSINIQTKEVTLEVKPKISIKSGEALDPSVNPTTGASLNNKVPIINTREISTVAKVQNGGILVIGGLISESSEDKGTGLPFLMRLPVFKYLFGFFTSYSQKIETVIFIKATVVENGYALSKNDKSFYNRHVNQDLFKEDPVSKYMNLPINEDFK